MKTYMILFLVGRDRPGIVDDVSTVLFEKKANIEDSRMATLGGCFSIMILMSFPDEMKAGIYAGLEELKAMGFEASLHEAGDPAAVPRRAGLPLRLEVTAMDHPGIVRKVVRILRAHDVNVESLNTRVTTAPLSGHPLFDLDLEAFVPAEKSIAAIKKELSDLAFKENLDLSFKK